MSDNSVATANIDAILAKATAARRFNWAKSVTAMLVFTGLWFGLLAHRPLFEPDEGRYAEIPREMLHGGDWVIPHLDGLAYLEKPPLQYWLTAAAYRLFGEHEWTARLVPGVSGYLTLIVIWLVSRRLWGTKVAWRAVMLCGASPLFMLLSHQLTLDMLLTFFLTTALSCFLLAHTSRRRHASGWMIGCWASVAFAVLTKGLIGMFLPAATLLLYSLWRGRIAMERLNLPWGAPLFALITLPWFILAARANGAFLHFFFIREHLQRFATPIEHRPGPWWYFIAVLAVGTLPWLTQCVQALRSPPTRLGPASKPRGGELDTRLLLWIWCAVTLVFFSISSSKLVPYILPMMPALALLCASTPGGMRGNLMINATLSVLAGCGILVYATCVWRSANTMALIGAIAPLLYVTAAVVLITAIAAFANAQSNRPDAALSIQCMGWFLACVCLLIGADRASSLFTEKNAANTLDSAGARSFPIFSVREYPQSLPFYLQRTITVVNYEDELTLGLRQQPDRAIASLSGFAQQWRRLGQAFAVMSRPTQVELARMGVPMVTVGEFPHEVVVRRR
jgi:4-amino-4-deoxy-L-arabinose transferase-like glycosyltransferase